MCDLVKTIQALCLRHVDYVAAMRVASREVELFASRSLIDRLRCSGYHAYLSYNPSLRI